MRQISTARSRSAIHCTVALRIAIVLRTLIAPYASPYAPSAPGIPLRTATARNQRPSPSAPGAVPLSALRSAPGRRIANLSTAQPVAMP
eukprot:3166687-Rhodomonas_salina.4